MDKLLMMNKLKKDLELLLAEVTSTTFEGSYEKLASLLLTYRGILTKEDVYSLFVLIENELDLSVWQEEVLWEISNRLSGDCMPHKTIILGTQE